jgi:hypothetical protein
MDAALTAFAGVYGGKPIRKRRKTSAKSRAKIAAAQATALEKPLKVSDEAKFSV